MKVPTAWLYIVYICHKDFGGLFEKTNHRNFYSFHNIYVIYYLCV